MTSLLTSPPRASGKGGWAQKRTDRKCGAPSPAFNLAFWITRVERLEVNCVCGNKSCVAQTLTHDTHRHHLSSLGEGRLRSWGHKVLPKAKVPSASTPDEKAARPLGSHERGREVAGPDRPVQNLSARKRVC